MYCYKFVYCCVFNRFSESADSLLDGIELGIGSEFLQEESNRPGQCEGWFLVQLHFNSPEECQLDRPAQERLPDVVWPDNFEKHTGQLIRERELWVYGEWRGGGSSVHWAKTILLLLRWDPKTSTNETEAIFCLTVFSQVYFYRSLHKCFTWKHILNPDIKILENLVASAVGVSHWETIKNSGVCTWTVGICADVRDVQLLAMRRRVYCCFLLM